MDFYSIWPLFFLIILLLFIAKTQVFDSIDASPNIDISRVEAIGGLRGFLAIGVFFQHAAIYHHYDIDGYWMVPHSLFYSNLGQVSVSIFFMITGFLFWSKVLSANGRPNFFKLYVGRLFRIMPLYLVLFAISILVAGVTTEWKLVVPIYQLIVEILEFAAGGIFQNITVNGYSVALLAFGVTWTLAWEWAFYVSLMATSLLARNAKLGIAFPLIAAGITFFFLLIQTQNHPVAFVLLFLVGMSVAALKSIQPQSMELIGKNSKAILSSSVLICVGFALMGFDEIYEAMPILFLGIAFACVIFGGDIFGLLLAKSAQRVGDVSFGIYLIQGPVSLFIFTTFYKLTHASTIPLMHWFLVTIAMVSLFATASFLHVIIERPGIRLGRSVLNRRRLLV